MNAGTKTPAHKSTESEDHTGTAFVSELSEAHKQRFVVLWNYVSPKLFVCCRKRWHFTHDGASENVQETAIRLWRQVTLLPSLLKEENAGMFIRAARSTCENVCREEERRTQRLPLASCSVEELSTGEQEIAVETEGEPAALSDRMRSWLDGLAETQRVTVETVCLFSDYVAEKRYCSEKLQYVVRYKGKLLTELVNSRTGMAATVQQVRGWLRRGLANLRSLLGDAIPQP